MNNIPRILIAGDRSSSGKTTITIGLMAVLKEMNYTVQGFKVGLDYIDPSYHTYVCERESRNLDGYLMDEETILEIFNDATDDADIAIIEGARGLYEGFDVFSDVGSTAQIAKTLKSPVILVVDASSITKSAAALVNGYSNFDSSVDIEGVILNHINGERHAKKTKMAVECYTNKKVWGIIPKDEDMRIPMRHLGLVPAKEGQKKWNFTKTLKLIKDIVKENIDVDEIIRISGKSVPIKAPQKLFFPSRRNSVKAKIKIGVAYDEVFNFYYYDNLRLLELNNAEIIPFSPVNDSSLPQIDALYIGGGYPELFVEKLSKNKIKHEIRKFCESGKPVYAECGGLIYLMDELQIGSQSFEMAGVIEGRCLMDGKRTIGYTHGIMVKNNIIGIVGTMFRGHEFHYSSIELERREKNFAYKLYRGKGVKDGKDGILVNNTNTLASYTHLHAASYRDFARHFVASAIT
jgi:cobyrinic acid a,c-diamide synthase